MRRSAQTVERMAGALSRFRSEERGAMTVFALFFFIIFIIIGGMAVDFMRFEQKRVRLQATLDRAVLAAADLDQSLGATDVVLDYFAKADLADAIDASMVDPDVRLNCRDVQAMAALDLPTYFLRLVDIDSMGVPSAARARECISDVEISLVLDVSYSMNSNDRIENLETAAHSFVEAMIDPAAESDEVSINIVPFADQVNLGPTLAGYFNLTDEHAFSDCVRFDADDFLQIAVDPNEDGIAGTLLQREGHFNRWQYNYKEKSSNGYNVGPLPSNRFTCVPTSDRHVMAWGSDVTALKNKISALTPRGNTSIDIGVKWGAALLDDAVSGIVDAEILAERVSADFAGRPFSHDESGVLKVLVVMSDGENTDQAWLTDDYMGDSGVWVDPNSSSRTYDDEYSKHLEYNGNDYWFHEDRWAAGYNPWRTYPDGYGGSQTPYQLTYHELFDLMSVKGWSDRIEDEYHDALDSALGQNNNYQWDTGFDLAVDYVEGVAKDGRLDDICTAAKDEGIIIFTIGFEIPVGDGDGDGEDDSRGDEVLKACATSLAHYFDPQGVEISEAFSAIASQINQLRLIE